MVCMTLPWREQDSNHRSRVTRPIFQIASGWFPPTEKSERTRTDTRSVGPFPRGTDGSNPVPSSGESGANLISGRNVFYFPGSGLQGHRHLLPCSRRDPFRARYDRLSWPNIERRGGRLNKPLVEKSEIEHPGTDLARSITFRPAPAKLAVGHDAAHSITSSARART